MPWRRRKRKIKKLENEIRYLYRYLGLNLGERQYAFSLDDVRDDHLGRYEFACRYIRSTHKVVDAACGIGYGSFLLAERTGAFITGIDISDSAIQSANQLWRHPNNQFLLADCTKTDIAKGSIDVAISFETIEHIHVADKLLEELYSLLRPGGLLICSTPNETRWPFLTSNHQYHVRHYTAEEITSLIEQSGFQVKDFLAQPSATSKKIVPGNDGLFHIVVAEKPDI